MKKLLLLAVMALFTSSTFAQLLTSSRVARGDRAHNIWVDLGVGTVTGDAENTGVAVDLGFRWTKMFTENVGWDILKLSGQTDTKSFKEALNAQVKTGVRGVSPVLFGNSTIYANFAGGYGYYFDMEKGGFVWEIGAGVNITPRFAVGINYNNANYKFGGRKKYEDEETKVKYGLLTLRLSYAF